MTNIKNNSIGNQVDVNKSRARQTQNASKSFASAVANTTAGVARSVGAVVPGGSILTAAASSIQNSVGSPNARNVSLAGTTTTSSTNDTFSAVNELAASGDSSATMFNATKELQELNQQFNLEYLNLQQEMQGENRKFSAISNVMKTKHDTAKGMIQNVR
ncbi:MAG: hypothetical protein VYA34_11355 [Myxococcota bacterium]|nr:hypothetical protein [Myxococcota bacterium]